MLRIEIAKPCDMTWTAMKGDERVRHCGACRKNVYNISTMTEAEVEELIRRTEGHFCARVYRRTDGRVLTADCPKGVARVRRRRALAVTAAFGAATLLTSPMFVMGGAASRPARRIQRTIPPSEEPAGDAIGLVPRSDDRVHVTLGVVDYPDLGREMAKNKRAAHE